jgi:hypothetical protein
LNWSSRSPASLPLRQSSAFGSDLVSRLFVGTWFWGSKYSSDYLDKLDAGVQRHLKVPHSWQVWHPEPEDGPLILMSGCFARLRMFSPAWQQKQGIAPGDRIVCLDLDSVVTGSLDALFDRPGTFTILQGANASNPCPYNGSIFMLRAGYHEEVWDDFSPEAAKAAPFYAFPDDQGWLAHKIPNADGWRVGSNSGIYAFQKPGWPTGMALPRDAKLVVFPGWRDPAKFTRLDWIQRHWLV